MSTVALRPATGADTEFFHAVYASGRAEELAVVPWTGEQKAAFLRSQSEAQLSHYAQHYPGTEYSVVVVDGEDAGRIFVQAGARELCLMEMTLLPSYRGRGVGTGLVRAVIDRAEALGLPAVLHVESFNRAKRLYERFGFAEAGDAGVYTRMVRPAGVRS